MAKDPRVVGGEYFCGYWKYSYIILAFVNSKITVRITDNSKVASNLKDDPGFAIGRVLSHSTSWDAGLDKVVALPLIGAHA